MSKNEFKFEPIEKKPLVVELTQKIMDYIFSGSIRPGDKLPAERQLSEALDVGRSAIREAIKALTVLGILEVKQGDGTYLRKADAGILNQSIEWSLLLGERKTLDLIEARKEIEIIGARLAAARATEEEIEELYHILQKMNNTNVKTFVENDILFHLKVMDMSKNQVIKDILLSIQTLLRTWINAVIESAGETDFSYQDHLFIFEAIKKRDSNAATVAMSMHMEDATKRLVQVLNESNSEKELVDQKIDSNN